MKSHVLVPNSTGSPQGVKVVVVSQGLIDWSGPENVCVGSSDVPDKGPVLDPEVLPRKDGSSLKDGFFIRGDIDLGIKVILGGMKSSKLST